MRRMYSEQELTKIIHDVVGDYIEDGAFDESISDAVDAYLVEHPVDITALEGQDVELNSLDATGLITGGEIVEKMSGYSFSQLDESKWSAIYVGVCKNGNKLSIVIFGSLNSNNQTSYTTSVARITVPSAVYNKLYPYTVGSSEDVLQTLQVLLTDSSNATTTVLKTVTVQKDTFNRIAFALRGMNSELEANKNYFFRIETTFLLSENLASSGE